MYGILKRIVKNELSLSEQRSKMFYSHLHFEEQKSTGLLDIAKKKYKGMFAY